MAATASAVRSCYVGIWQGSVAGEIPAIGEGTVYFSAQSGGGSVILRISLAGNVRFTMTETFNGTQTYENAFANLGGGPPEITEATTFEWSADLSGSTVGLDFRRNSSGPVTISALGTLKQTWQGGIGSHTPLSKTATFTLEGVFNCAAHTLTLDQKSFGPSTSRTISRWAKRLRTP